MNLTQAIEFFRSHGACSPAIRWLKKQKKARKSLRYAIENCGNFDWLEWWALEVNLKQYKKATSAHRRSLDKNHHKLTKALDKSVDPYRKLTKSSVIPLYTTYEKTCKEAKARVWELLQDIIDFQEKAYDEAIAPHMKVYREAIESNCNTYEEACKIEARKILLTLLDK